MSFVHALFVVLLVGAASETYARIPAGLLSALSDEAGWFRVSGDSDLSGLLTDRHRGNDEIFGVSIKYIVPPEHLHSFAKEWKKLEKAATDEGGILYYAMHKTLNDNYMFVLCGEWKSYDDYIDHLKSSCNKDWIDWLGERQIIWFIRPVTKVTDDFLKSRSANRRSKHERIGLMFSFHVHQKYHQEFVDAWTDLGKKASNEDGNEMYILRKNLLDNSEFFGHGVWQSWDDVWDHLESDHFDNMRNFAASKDVFWTLSPLKGALDTWD